MVILQIKLNIPSGKSREFEQTVFILLDRFRKQKGCLSYHLCRDVMNKSFSYLIAEWKDTSALEKHFQTGDFKLLLGSIHSLGETKDVHICIPSADTEELKQVLEN